MWQIGRMETDLPSTPVRTARDAARLFAPIFVEIRQERLVVAHLDTHGHLLGLNTSDAGREDEVALPIREIVQEALTLGAQAIVIAHNHPSGDPRPSEQDRIWTRKLAEVGKALGLTLRDHLIFAGGECRSLRGMGLL
jgi:DNA repair protein RadC